MLVVLRPGPIHLKVEVFDATTQSWVISSVFKAMTTSAGASTTALDQTLELMTTSASIVGIQDHQAPGHQTIV